MQRIPLIELVDVHHSGATICGATLQIWRGETVAIRGPAGAGKTTLLRLLAGALTPSQGLRRYSATSEEEGLDAAPAGQSGLAGIAFLSQRPSFMLTLSVLDHVMVGLLARGLRDRALIRKRATGGLLEAGVVHMANTPMSMLAMRERRLVLVAEALALDARLVFVDEGYGASVAKLAAPGRTLIVVINDELGIKVDRSLHVDVDGTVRVLERSTDEAA